MPKVKLTDADVRGLCYARNVEGAPLRWLAENYGVSMAQVSRVTRGLQRRRKVTVDDLRNARKILQAAGVNPMVDTKYIVAEVSSHEETPEVGKWSDDVIDSSLQFQTKTLSDEELKLGPRYKYVTIDRPAVDGESEEAWEYFFGEKDAKKKSEVGKLSVAGPPVNRSEMTTIYTDTESVGSVGKEEIVKRWFEAWDRLKSETSGKRAEKIVQEF